MHTIYRWINLVLEKFLILIFSLLVLDVLVQVIARYIFSNPPSFTEEFARFSLIWLSVLGLAYLSGQREHLTMDYFYKKVTDKKRYALMVVIESLIILFAITVMVFGGGNLVYITISLGQLSSALQVSLGYVYMVVPISGGLIIFYSIFNIANHRS